MRKTLAVVATTAALSFTGIATASAATGPVSAPGTQVTADDTNQSDDNQDKTGLWGLLGLAGLAGLARRRETADTHNH
ncbi:MAG: hypothetical protein JWN77_1432 [Frankiales bacterium]|jgi:MYXO-CTERM domain-containing protein|nr:hypothetical protein [Frankiales bacterium]